MCSRETEQKKYTAHYPSPLGVIALSADAEGLAGLWFETEEEPVAATCSGEDEPPVFGMTKRWLDLYFSGREPDFCPPLHLVGTDFQMEVWDLLRQIPYGETVSYSDLALQIAASRETGRMSAQAVGGAVGRNPIAIIVPCHRVIGANGSLVGYRGGIERKAALLKKERMAPDVERTLL